MSLAKITLYGMARWMQESEDDLFANMTLPTGWDKDLLVDTIMLHGAEFEVLYAEPQFMKNAIGIWSDKHDAHFNDCFVIDYTVGMRIFGSSNRISRCHLWGGTVPPENYSVEEWSGIYGERKQKLLNGVYGNDNNGKYGVFVEE